MNVPASKWRNGDPVAVTRSRIGLLTDGAAVDLSLVLIPYAYKPWTGCCIRRLLDSLATQLLNDAAVAIQPA